MADDYFYISGKNIEPWNDFPELTVGDVAKTGDVNPFFNYFLKQLPGGVTIGGGQRLSSIDYLNRVRHGHLKPNIPLDRMADIGQRIAMHFCKYTRELIWESVRQESFSHLPSRQKCVWLSHGLKNLSYWEGALGRAPGTYSVFRVELNGTIHEASDDFLMSDEVIYTEAIKMANDYWNGKITNPTKKEVLFEGDFTIKDKLK